MNCREAERLLDTFFDGELDGRLMREAALHITRCRACERELQEKENLQELLVDTIEGQIDEGDVARIWTAVHAGIGASGAAQPGERAWRLAAATSTVRGMLVGERPARVERGRETAHRAAAPRRSRSLSVGAVSAVAAAAAMFLFLGDAPEEDAVRSLGDRRPPEARPVVAAAAQPVAVAPSQPVAVAPSLGSAGALDGRDPRGLRAAESPAASLLARAPQPSAGKGGAPRQVQIDSLEHSGGAMAMWSEPSATVIWIGDSAPRRASVPTPR